MSNENKGQTPAEELMDFLAAGKEARHVRGSEGEHRKRYSDLHGESDRYGESEQPDESAAVRPSDAEQPAEPAVDSEVADLRAALTESAEQPAEPSRNSEIDDLRAALSGGDKTGTDTLSEFAALVEMSRGAGNTSEEEALFARLDAQAEKAAEPKAEKPAELKAEEPEKSAEPKAEEAEQPAEPAEESAAAAAAAETAAFKAEESASKPIWKRLSRRKADEDDFDDDDDDDDWDDDDDDDDEVDDDDLEDVRVIRRRKRGLVAGLIVMILAAGIFAGSSLVAHRQTIYPKVSIQGVDLGGMTVDEAEAAMREAGWDGGDSTVLKVTLPSGDSFDVSSELTGWTATAKQSAQAAWDYGREDNVLANFVTFLRTAASGYDLTDDLMRDPDVGALRKLVDKSVDKANETLGDGSLNVDTDAKLLRLVKGGDLLAVESNDVYMQVLEALENHKSELNYVRSGDSSATAKDIDMQKLHDEVCGEPENASYDVEKKEVVDGKPGIEFDVKQAEKLWKQAEIGDTVEIPLEVTEPTFMKADFKGLFSDKLASKTTSLSGSSANRVNNITLAAQKINGVILNPGDTFSYNTTVGQRTTAAGFREAGAYANGEVVSEVGGGICQVSSTLYHCAMTSNLKITARTNHYFSVGYIEPGMDATVSWGNPDFKFQNDRTFPVKIVAYVKNGSVTVEIWGTDVDGTTVKMDYTSNGLTTTTYRNVYDKDGKLLSRTQEAVSTYHTHENTAPANTTRPTYTTRPVVTAAPPAHTATPVEPTSAPTAAPTTEPTQTPTAPPEETEPPIQTSAPPEEMPPEDPGE